MKDGLQTSDAQEDGTLSEHSCLSPLARTSDEASENKESSKASSNSVSPRLKEQIESFAEDIIDSIDMIAWLGGMKRFPGIGRLFLRVGEDRVEIFAEYGGHAPEFELLFRQQSDEGCPDIVEVRRRAV
jgi:hypothetical protein